MTIEEIKEWKKAEVRKVLERDDSWSPEQIESLLDVFVLFI